MAKPDQESYKTLRALVPIAKTILELEEVFETGLGLKAQIAALESRKTTLSNEVGDLLKKNEAARAELRQTRAELDLFREGLAVTRKTEADTFAAEHDRRLKIAADQAQAVREQHDVLVKHLKDERERLKGETAELDASKQSLLNEIDGLLLKHARR